MDSPPKVLTTGIYHTAVRMSGSYQDANAKLKEHLRRRAHHDVDAHIARALEDGREYVVRKWTGTATLGPDDADLFIVHASVFIRDEGAALVGDAVPLEALPPIPLGHLLETVDGRRFRLERGGVADLRYWRRIL